MKTVYILWQDKTQAGRMWHAVAKLTQTESGSYLFNYTEGAKNPRFQPFPRMNDKSKKYESSELFGFLKNRIPPASRPEHEALFDWCNLTSESSYLDLLAISGGEKATDSYRVFSVPEQQNGFYFNTFFVSGIRHLDKVQKSKIQMLQENQTIAYELEDLNINDPHAILLFEKETRTTIGYYPRYLTDDLRKLHSLHSSVEIKVVKVNLDAPEQFRLLCRTKAKWPKYFQTCNHHEFQDYVLAKVL
ncbi:MAG: hypothetical protein O2793_13330 [Proteobacteria bacterium]|nr:hypothetical protein [Pseudomonadota bacterium]MDA1253945.1 hypothetical protein [Pseudomonadota bacterium]